MDDLNLIILKKNLKNKKIIQLNLNNLIDRSNDLYLTISPVVDYMTIENPIPLHIYFLFYNMNHF